MVPNNGLSILFAMCKQEKHVCSQHSGIHVSSRLHKQLKWDGPSLTFRVLEKCF